MTNADSTIPSSTIPEPPTVSPSEFLRIGTTSYGGRGFFASKDIPKGTVVLTCATPVSSVVFRQFKRDTCAYCMKCDFHKTCKVKLDQQKVKTLVENYQKLATDSTSDPRFSNLIPKNAFSNNTNGSAFGGLFFCSETCANNWLDLEDPTGIVSLTLNLIDQAVLAASKNPAAKSTKDLYNQEDESFEKSGKTITDEYIQQRWDECMNYLPLHNMYSTFSSDSSCSVTPSVFTPVIPRSPDLSSIQTSISSLGSENPKSTEIPVLEINDLELTPKFEIQPTIKRKPRNKMKKVFLKLSPEETDIARFISIIVIKQFLKDTSITQSPTVDGFCYFESLQSNETLYLSKFPWMLSSHLQIFNFLHNTLPTTLVSSLTESLFRSSLGRDAANAFGIWQLPVTPESELLGSSLYPLASFFNHSCRHTVDKIRTGRELGFITNKDIEKEEQLYINYGMYNELEREERQETLKDQWFFGCLCDKCEEQK